MKQRAWTTAEIAEMRRLADYGSRVVAFALGRSELAVRLQASRHGVSLRRVAVPEDDPEAIAELVRVAQGLEYKRHCIACGSRFVAFPVLELCRACHRKVRAQATQAIAERADASSQMTMTRQRKHRALYRLRDRTARKAYLRDVVRWEANRTDLRPKPELAVWEDRYARWLPSAVIETQLVSARSPHNGAKPDPRGPTASAT